MHLPTAIDTHKYNMSTYVNVYDYMQVNSMYITDTHTHKYTHTFLHNSYTKCIRIISKQNKSKETFNYFGWAESLL